MNLMMPRQWRIITESFFGAEERVVRLLGWEGAWGVDGYDG